MLFKLKKERTFLIYERHWNERSEVFHVNAEIFQIHSNWKVELHNSVFVCRIFGPVDK